MKNHFLLLLLALFACNEAPTNTSAPAVAAASTQTEATAVQTSSEEPGFIHTVFFWYKEGTTEERKKAFEASFAELGKVPSIQKYYAGPPAGTPRDVVDNSYDYAFIVHFKNSADQDAYQVDPLHLKFIELYKDVWDRVQVYDTLLD